MRAAAPINPTDIPANSGSIQKVLDENVKLITLLINYQQNGNTKDAHAIQQTLHKNLIQLATIADQTTAYPSPQKAMHAQGSGQMLVPAPVMANQIPQGQMGQHFPPNQPHMMSNNPAMRHQYPGPPMQPGAMYPQNPHMQGSPRPGMPMPGALGAAQQQIPGGMPMQYPPQQPPVSTSAPTQSTKSEPSIQKPPSDPVQPVPSQSNSEETVSNKSSPSQHLAASGTADTPTGSDPQKRPDSASSTPKGSGSNTRSPALPADDLESVENAEALTKKEEEEVKAEDN